MQKKILYPILTILWILFFSEGISVTFYDRFTTLVAIIGSIGTCALFMLSVSQFVAKPNPLKETESNGSAEGFIIFGLILASLFGSGIFYIYHAGDIKEREFRNHGQFAMATITDGNSTSSDKFDFTSIKVKFHLKDESEYTAIIEVSASEFSNYYIDQDVPIVYSVKRPSLAKIIHNNEIEKYTHKKSKALQLADLLKIYELKSGDLIYDYLNALNPQEWKYEGDTYVNSISMKAIKNEYPVISYIHNSYDASLFSDELNSLGFTSSPVKPAGRTAFTDGKFIIIKHNSIIYNDNGSGTTQPRNVTVVSIKPKG